MSMILPMMMSLIFAPSQAPSSYRAVPNHSFVHRDLHKKCPAHPSCTIMVNPLDFEENLKSQLTLNKFSRRFSKYILLKENWAIDNNQLPAWQIYFISLLIVANLDQLWSFFCQFLSVFYIFLRIFRIPCQPLSVRFYNFRWIFTNLC